MRLTERYARHAIDNAARWQIGSLVDALGSSADARDMLWSYRDDIEEAAWNELNAHCIGVTGFGDASECDMIRAFKRGVKIIAQLLADDISTRDVN